MQSYKYPALKENEIRLLQILPGLDSEIVSCILTHVSLDDPPEYAALSYTWGEAPSRSICVNGQSLLVTPNLEAALREFRSRPVWFVPDQELERFEAILTSSTNLLERYPPSRPSEHLEKIRAARGVGLGLMGHALECSELEDDSWNREWSQVTTKLGNISKEIEELWGIHALREGVPMLHQEPHFLWVDAICINQGDFKERGEQVQLMRRIYKEAKSLTVWLGPEKDDSSTAFSVLRKFKKDQAHVFDAPFESDACPPRLVDPEEAWSAIRMLFRRPWFSRAWIVQEYTLGGQDPTGLIDAVTFCCRKERMFNPIEVSMDILKQKANQDWESHKIRITVCSFYSTRTSSSLRWRSHLELPVNKYQLLPIILDSNVRIAKDPRDKIYAFLGLAEEVFGGAPADFASKTLILNYSATVEDVYSSFVRAVVEATKRLDILGTCYREKESEYVRRTWTTDWTILIHPGILTRDIMASVVPELYEFTYDVTPGVECTARFADDLSTLTVTGFVWDQIVFVSSTLSGTEPDSEAVFKKDCQEILNLAKETWTEDKGHRLTADCEDVLLKILVWNIKDERAGKIFPDTWKTSFRRWIMDETLTGTNTIPGAVSGEAQILPSSNETVPDDDSGFTAAVHKSMILGHQVILTHDGCIGRSWSLVKVGDVVCILLGCAVPMIFRPIDGHYELVIEAYVPGIMHGEAMAALEDGRKTLQEFELH
jgi:Heterokaryon incompatibility protein (HET)